MNKPALNNQKGNAALIIIILIVIIIIAVGTWVFVSNSNKTNQLKSSQQTSNQQNSASIYSIKGTVVKNQDNQLTIKLDNNQEVTGLIDDQTRLVNLKIPETNPEGERSGKLFDRNEISLNDIKSGDVVVLRSYPDTPINDLQQFTIKTLELHLN